MSRAKRRGRVRLASLAAILLAQAAPALPGRAEAAPAAAPPGRVRFLAGAPGAHVRVEARFPARPGECQANQPRPLSAAYPGVVEVGRRSNGLLYLVTELTFPEYLKGIDEVPRSWPLEALKAQVVAARTYAVAHMDPGTALARELDFNLCATDACQVYRGLRVERGPWGDRWAQAVDETAGEILEYNGRPASTFYFSTSNGQTYSNADVWGGTPLPYLEPIVETDDLGSSVSRWIVRMPLADVAEALRLAGAWGTAPIESVARRRSEVVLAGGGNEAALALSSLRNHLNRQAVCLEPKRYPTSGSNGRPLPQVVPSLWMELRQEGADLVMEGRGWGHGVGMVQWGLKGKAEKGMGYAEMLAFYYGGLKPVRRSEPGTIRIGLSGNIEEITIERVGPVRVEGAAVGEGPVVMRGGADLTISAGQPIQPVLRVERVSTTGAALPGAPAQLSFDLSAAANVAIRYRAPDGAEGEVAAVPLDRGPQTLTWDAAVGALPFGAYEVVLVADDGVSQVVSAPLGVTVLQRPARAGPSPGPPTPGPEAPGTDRRLLLAAAGLLAVMVALTAVGLMARGRGAR